MNKREMIEALKRDEKDKDEVATEIDALIAEKERQITDLAQREIDQEKRLLDGVERMHADYKREGEDLTKELNHYLRIRKKFQGELAEPLALEAPEQQQITYLHPQKKKARRWI